MQASCAFYEEAADVKEFSGGNGTNFFVDLGSLTGELIATDGIPVRPIQGKRFPIAIAQRIDVRVQVPREGGVFPILALRELATEQTGIVLATAGARVQQLPEKARMPAGLLTLEQERKLAATSPLSAKAADQINVLRLQGNMRAYDWLINGHAFDVNNPASEKAEVRVKEGQRVALKFVNETPMSHPMHLHGHSFQVIGINDQRLSGAVRDSVLVPGKTSVTVNSMPIIQGSGISTVTFYGVSRGVFMKIFARIQSRICTKRAKALGIKGRSRMSRQQLIEAIEHAA